MFSVLTHFLRWSIGIDAATTQTTDAERECMVRYARTKKRLAEIGVWEGVTARQLRDNISADAVYFAIDPYPVGRLGFSTQKVIAHRTVEKARNGRVVWIEDTGVNAASHDLVKERPIDFLFIDGDHSYEGLKGDWQAWSPLIAIGGIVALHDSRSTPKRMIDDAGSVQFTNEAIVRDPKFRIVETVDSLTILERIA
jgi:predicted O-methyltransferase YrrM